MDIRTLRKLEDTPYAAMTLSGARAPTKNALLYEGLRMVWNLTRGSQEDPNVTPIYYSSFHCLFH